MSILSRSVSGLKPLIFVAWFVAAMRLVADACTTDLNFLGMLSVYGVIAFVFLYAGFSGILDALVWKPLLLGSVVLGVTCFFVPNTIAYSVAQFQGWNHGRFQVDAEHYAIQKPLMENGMGLFEAKAKSEEILGRPDPTRGPPIAETTGGKIKVAATIGAFTTIAGTLWSLVFGTLFVGIPATFRRRRAA